MKTIGFIGGGRITRIFLMAFAKNEISTDGIIVSDPNQDVLNKLKAEFPQIITTSINKEVAKSEIVFISVHPPVMAETLKEISDTIRAESILVSLAPKFTIDKIKSLLNGFDRVARMIPNAPSIIGKGFNPVVYNLNITDKDKKELMVYFNSFGKTKEVSEEKLEAYAILAAMGPTYFWFQFNELKKLSVEFGLTSEDAEQAILEMISGAIETQFNSKMNYDEVINLVPVKPLSDSENIITDLYRNKLTEIFNRIKPA